MEEIEGLKQENSKWGKKLGKRDKRGKHERDGDEREPTGVAAAKLEIEGFE